VFRRTPDYNFLCTFGCLCFPFLRPYHAHKLDFRSSPCVFLGYSSSHLGYRCLDLESDRIYVSCHVRFHENIFPFAKSEQVTSSPVPPTPPTYLPSLHPPPSFQPTTYQTSPNHNPILPFAAPHQITTLPIDSATPSSPSHTTILSPYAFLSNDHCAGTGSPSPDVHVLRSAATQQPGSTLAHPSSVAASPVSAVLTSPSTASPAGLQLYVDLSSYPIQPLPGTSHTSPCPATRQHPMVLRPRQPKTALSTATAAASAVSFNWVVSPPSHEPLVFNDASKYEAWHSVMPEEIQALRTNRTWTLVTFHPSMNVVGSRWVYKIKRRSDGSIERYKVRLVARGFTQQEVLITLKPLVQSSNRRPSD